MKGRFFQFRLRTLLLAMVAAVGACVAVLEHSKRVERQYHSAKKLRHYIRYDEELDYDPKTPWSAPRPSRQATAIAADRWYEKLFGEETFRSIPYFQIKRNGMNNNFLPLDETLRHYKNLRGVTILRLQGGHIKDEHFAELTDGRRLEELELTRVGISDSKILEVLKKCKHLKRLSLQSQLLSADVLSEIAKRKSLCSIRIGLCQIPADINFSTLKNLRSVSIIGSKAATDEAISLRLPQQLKYVALDNTPIDFDDAFSGPLRDLVQLSCSGGLTDSQLDKFADSLALRTLNIARSPVTEKGVDHLRSVPITQLIMDTNQANTEMIDTLKHLSELKSIILIPASRESADEDADETIKILKSQLPHVNSIFSKYG